MRKHADTQKLLTIQAAALETGDAATLKLAWVGLGYHRDVAFVAATAADKDAARAALGSR